MMRRLRRVLGSGVLLLGLLAVVWCLVLREVSLADLRAVLVRVRPVPLAVALGSMVLCFLCEAASTSWGLKSLGYRVSLGQGLQYAATGFFFSAVTPSSTGGQPMQLYQMRRRGVDPAHGALVLLLELACWKVAAAVLGLWGLFLVWDTLACLPEAVQAAAWVGIGLNLAVLLCVLMALLRPGWAKRLGCRVAVKLAGCPRAARLWTSAEAQLTVFTDSAPALQRDLRTVGIVLVLTTVQLLALYSVPYWVYRALGLTGHSPVYLIAIQAAVNLAVSALPLPGAMGAGEGAFLVLFGPVFPAELLGSALLLSRGVSFYLIVVLTGVSLLPGLLRKRFQSARQACGGA